LIDRISLHNVFADDPAPLTCAPFTFSGGEPHVQLDPKQIEGQYLWLDARLGTADGFLRTLAVLDAARACHPRRLGLFIPYFPGARQDRRQPGTPFTLSLYADAIARLAPDVVVTLDPHSDVLAARLDIEIIPAHAAMDRLPTYTGWICPDAGAEKRVHEAARALNQHRILHARKTRNAATGKLSGFQCEPITTPGNYLVVDDICDGGGTFIGLADAIRAPGTESADHTLDLWTSHGIFSKGLGELLNRFRAIHTTDSFPFAGPSSDRLIVHELHDLAAAAMRRRISS
jgi:ribose-phosphate pyrophosphokinase